MKTSLNKLILLPFILILGIVLFSEYNANETKKKLDLIEKELDQKIRVAKEKDSIKSTKQDRRTKDDVKNAN